MRKNFLFLGFAIPDYEMNHIFKEDSNPAIQTHKFIWNVIKGIENDDKIDYTYISTRPVSDYPYYPHLIIKKNIFKFNLSGKIIEIVEIPFVNISVIKLITRFISGLYYSIVKYRKVKNKAGVIAYSVHVPFMIIAYIISRIYRIDYIAIWTDPPSVISERESFFKSKLRAIEYLLSKSLMKKADKIISLTKYLAEDFAPGKPYIIIEGLIDKNEINKNIKNTSETDNEIINVIYTGSLDKRYGINNIVEGFRLIKSSKFILQIYGRGDYENDLISICSKNENIKYNGFVPNEEIIKIQRNADFLINARSADDNYVRYSFPSKTLEYMLSGTPIIMTMLPGIPECYKDYIIMLDNNKPTTIAETIKSLVNIDKVNRNELGLKAQDFALEKDYLKQGKLIIDFLDIG